MRVFEREQRVVNVNGLEVGGQPGERPVVLVASLFYSGHRAVQDHKAGKFDASAVERDIQLVLEWSDKTGLPVIFDVVGSYQAALEKYVEFVAGHCEVPFLVDGTNDDSRVPAIRTAGEWGLLDRAILNSIDHQTSDDTLREIREIGVKHAVLLAFESRHLFPEKKLALLRGVEGKFKGLLQKAEEAGLEGFLVDVAVLDVPSISFCARAQQLVKEEFGLPVGCAPANAIFEWEKAKELFGREGRWSCDAAACVFLEDNYADFILFGPANKAPQVFPAVAMRDALGAYFGKRVNKIRPKPGPLSKIF
ncbi:MAG: [methyl-Co(III) glycine betaine-specific corrinoid protein]--tetrahydrofolate methyltransferase MtgA [Promethearchaeota archaeon]